jgi:predicted Rossmann fold flavoprotein
MLFAHFGITGPIILYLSRHAVVQLKQKKKVEIALNLKPALTREQLDMGLQRDWQEHPKQQLRNALTERLPERLIPRTLETAGVDGDKRCSEVSKKDRNKLLDTFFRWRLEVDHWLSKEVAEVTAGGVDLKAVDPKTLESKIVKGLFWTGEVLDVDGYIGGYNFQAAWSTGWVAGQVAARYC